MPAKTAEYVIGLSVALRWYIPALSHQEEARRLLERDDIRLIAPASMAVGVVGHLVTACRNGQIKPEAVERIVESVTLGGPDGVRYINPVDHIGTVLKLVMEHEGMTVDLAMYLAVASAMKAPFVTANQTCISDFSGKSSAKMVWLGDLAR